MKRTFIVYAALVLVACKSNPKSEEATYMPAMQTRPDTVSVVQEHPQVSPVAGNETQSSAPVKHHTEGQKVKETKAEKTSSSGAAATANNSNTGTSAASSEPGDAAATKKGWSKTAKGAVIGGVVGAGAGAVIDKNNRAAGAVIGAAVGAGAGAIIGNQMDKKDGRH